MLGVATLKPDVRDKRRSAVARAGHVDRVEVVLLDEPVQVDVNEVQPRRRAPMPEQARLDVLDLQRLAHERVRHEVDLADVQVIRRAPPGVHLVEEVIGGGWTGGMFMAGVGSVGRTKMRRSKYSRDAAPGNRRSKSDDLCWNGGSQRLPQRHFQTKIPIARRPLP